MRHHSRSPKLPETRHKKKNYGYFLILSCIFQQEFISFYNPFLFACLNLLP